MASTLNLKTPGVYIQEISKFPPSVAQVETAIPAFIGYTEKAKLKVEDDLINDPLRITSLIEYEQFFGGPIAETNLQVTLDEQQDAIGNRIDLTVNASFLGDGPSNYKMYYSLQLYFANGGGPCYIVSVGKYDTGSINFADLTVGQTAIEKEDEVTLIVFPEGQGMLDINEYHTLQQASLAQCEKLQDRFAVMDIYLNNDIAIDDIEEFRNGIGTNSLKYGAAYYPNLESIFDYYYGDDEASVVINHRLNGADGGPLTGTLASLKSVDNRLYSQAKGALTSLSLLLPPSVAMVGIYAKVDSNRGVWKAPANVSVNAVAAPALKISDEEQESLNVDVVAGKSVNAIRAFAGRGIIVWGARTLAGNDNEWRYVSVRRFFNMAEESIQNATVQFVFEPNDANTWVKVRAMIENFLTLQWRAGALAGAVPEDAFYVKVGLNETMTALDILEGRMIVEIGMAVVRPAEFIILKFSHKMQES